MSCQGNSVEGHLLSWLLPDTSQLLPFCFVPTHSVARNLQLKLRCLGFHIVIAVRVDYRGSGVYKFWDTWVCDALEFPFNKLQILLWLHLSAECNFLISQVLEECKVSFEVVFWIGWCCWCRCCKSYRGEGGAFFRFRCGGVSLLISSTSTE